MNEEHEPIFIDIVSKLVRNIAMVCQNVVYWMAVVNGVLSVSIQSLIPSSIPTKASTTESVFGPLFVPLVLLVHAVYDAWHHVLKRIWLFIIWNHEFVTIVHGSYMDIVRQRVA